MENRRFIKLTPAERNDKLWRVLRRATDNRIGFAQLRRIEESAPPDAQYHIAIYGDKEAFMEGIMLNSRPFKDKSRLLYGRVMPGVAYPGFALPSAMLRDETAALAITRHSREGRRELHIYLPEPAEGRLAHEIRDAL